jgi:hypothetical protein
MCGVLWSIVGTDGGSGLATKVLPRGFTPTNRHRFVDFTIHIIISLAGIIGTNIQRLIVGFVRYRLVFKPKIGHFYYYGYVFRNQSRLNHRKSASHLARVKRNNTLHKFSTVIRHFGRISGGVITTRTARYRT